MKELQIETIIDAAPDQVWDVLTGFGLYRKWNPYFVRVDGEPALGRRLHLTIDVPNGRSMTLNAQIITFDPPHTLTWKWRVGPPGLMAGEHKFTVEPHGDNQVRLVDREVIRGVLLPLYSRSLDTNTRHGMEMMGQALKEQVEQVATAPA